MKGEIFFQSKWGNSRQIAEAIGKGLEASGHEVAVKRVKEAEPDPADDFIVLGGPTRMARAYGPIKKLAKNGFREGWAGKPFATFSTGASVGTEKANQQASEVFDELLKGHGLSEIAPPLMAKVQDMHGPLDEGELERAEEYGKELGAKLSAP